MAVPLALLLPVTRFPQRASSWAISSGGKPVSVKVRKGVFTFRPIISQWPVMVSLPRLVSSSRAYLPWGASPGPIPSTG